MYFPYLYGRRAERNALIDVASDLGSSQKVHPIVEPYSSAGDLIKLLDTYRAVGTKIHLIVNPTRGTLQTKAEQTAWATAVSGYIAQPALVTPVLHVFGSTSPLEISNFLAAYPKRDVALVILQGGLSAVTLATAIGSRAVRLFVGPQAAVTDYATAMPSQHVIALVPRFLVVTNALYPPESTFSLDPSSYGAAGFGDYALIDSSPPRAGGGAGAGAVAVHMTYQDTATKEMKVQHFLSDDRVQGALPDSLKLLQALKHMTDQQAATPRRFPASLGYKTLESYLTTARRTSLEKSKQQQIGHHLHTMALSL